MSNADRIQLVINTLQMIDMKSSVSNMENMLASIQALTEIMNNVRILENSNKAHKLEDGKQGKDDDVKVEVFECGRAD